MTEPHASQPAEDRHPLAIIREFLGRTEPQLRCNALTALAALGSRSSFEQLIQQTRQDHDPAVRRHGIDELLALELTDSTQGCLEAVHALAVSDWDPAIRAHALGRLIEHHPKSPQTLGLVHRAALEDPDPSLRRHAAGGLRALDRPEALEGLGRVAVADPDVGVRQQATEALQALGTPELRTAVAGLWKGLESGQPIAGGDRELQAQATYALLGQLAHQGHEVPNPPGSLWNRFWRTLSVRNLPDVRQPRRLPWAGWWWGTLGLMVSSIVILALLGWQIPTSAAQPASAAVFLMVVSLVWMVVAGGRPTPFAYHYDRPMAWLSQVLGSTLRIVLFAAGSMVVITLFTVPSFFDFFRWPAVVLVALSTVAATITVGGARLGAFQAFRAFAGSRWRRVWQVVVGTAVATLGLVILRWVWRAATGADGSSIDALGLGILVVFLPLAIGLSIVAALTDGPVGAKPPTTPAIRRGLSALLVFVAAGLLLPTVVSIVGQGGLWSTPKAVDGETTTFTFPFGVAPTRQAFSADFLQRVSISITENQDDEIAIDSLFRLLDDDRNVLVVADDPPTGEYWVGPGDFQVEADLYTEDYYSGIVSSSPARSDLGNWMQDFFSVVWGGAGRLGSVELVLNTELGPMTVVDPATTVTLDGEGLHYFRSESSVYRGRFDAAYSQRVSLRVMETSEETLEPIDTGFLYLEIRRLGEAEPVAHDIYRHDGEGQGANLTFLLSEGEYGFCLVRLEETVSDARLDDQIAESAQGCQGSDDGPSTRFEHPLHLVLSTDGDQLTILDDPNNLRAAEEGETLSAAWQVTETPARWPLRLDQEQMVDVSVTQDSTDLVIELYRDGESIAYGDDPCEINQAILSPGDYEIRVTSYGEDPGPLSATETLQLSLEASSDETPAEIDVTTGEPVRWELRRQPVRLPLTLTEARELSVEVTQDNTDMVVSLYQDGELLEEGDDPSEIRVDLDPGSYEIVITEYLVEPGSAPTPMADIETVTVTVDDP